MFTLMDRCSHCGSLEGAVRGDGSDADIQAAQREIGHTAHQALLKRQIGQILQTVVKRRTP